MFVNKVESEKGELEIVYDVQWKTPGNDDDKAKIIGIVDTPDTNLDWSTFKSYLIQNSGNMKFTTDDIRISYLDSDDDLIPVDSEVEFRECLKFSRIRARRGRKIVMKVSMVSNQGAKPKDPSKYGQEPSGKYYSKPRLFCLKKRDIPDKMAMKKSAILFDKACSTPPHNNSELKYDRPDWFEEYMAKFKTELVQEITSAVTINLRSALGSMHHGAGGATSGAVPHLRCRTGVEIPQSGGVTPSSKGHHHHHHHLHHVLEKRKKKKKMPEEDSSDCTDGLQLNWEERMEVLRHMQKINKREKKFEKKLDAKLEKLESKTKKIMEKRNCLWAAKKNAGLVACSPPSADAQGAAEAVSKPPVAASAPVQPSSTSYDLVWDAMDATPVDVYSVVPHVLRGEVIDQVWKIMNNGQVPWTEETELRFAWGSKSLVPLTTSVKCPPLKPGETGKVKVSLQAPLFPGNFESYWHFHHQGRRFGHWLGCAVIVDPESRSELSPFISSTKEIYVSLSPLPVDLTMKCQENYQQEDNYNNRSSTTDDMKIHNIETKPDLSPKLEEDPKVLQPKSGTPQSKFTAESVVENPETVKQEISAPSQKELNQQTEKDSAQKTVEESVKRVIETDLEEYPRLESYTSLTEPELKAYMAESFPDLVRRSNESLIMTKPDLNAWANYLPHGATKHVEERSSGEGLNIKNEAGKSLDKNLCKDNEEKDENTFNYDKILSKLESFRLQDEEKKSAANKMEGQDGMFEYCSGSDSDNISIISGAVSVDTDDSEPSEEFVVVPMSTCINCESLEPHSSDSLPVTQPISVEIPKTPSDSDISAVQASDNNNNMELKSYPEMPQVIHPVLVAGEGNSVLAESTSQGSFQNVAETSCNFQPSEPFCQTIPQSLSNGEDSQKTEQKEEQKCSSDDENTVYVRDSHGNSIPVAKVVQPKLVGVGVGIGHVSHLSFGDPNFGQGPTGPRFPFACSEAGASPPLYHNPGGACNFRPQHESPNCANFYAGPPAPPVNKWYGTEWNYPTQYDQQKPPPQQQQPEFVQQPNYMSTLFKQRYQQQQQHQQQQQQHQQQQQQQHQQQQQQHQNEQQQRSAQCAYRPAASTYCPFDELYQQQEAVGTAASMSESAGAATWTNAYHNIHTEQPRSSKYSYVFNNSVKETSAANSTCSTGTRSSSGSTRRSTTESRETSPVAAAVQILPETLVTGAVNVASSAINTARSVIDMLRPRHEEPVVAQWEQLSPAVESALRTLSEMGFNNRELNLLLLAQNNNDVTRVISELVQ